MFNTMQLTIDKTIATITFNRPDSMNALNAEMIDELAKVTEQVHQNSTIRAVLLRGAGPMFMVGGDINYFHENINQSSASVKHLVNTLNKAVTFILTMQKPVLACVHGSVAGAGLSVMLAADLVIAEENTKFTTAYSGIGISPDGGLSYTLPRTVGLKKAMELVLSSEIFDTKKALEWGMINDVATADTLAEKTQKILYRLANGPSFALAQSKTLLNQSQETTLEKQLSAEAEKFAQCYATHDFHQGIKSFLKKTKPEFAGN